MKCPHPNCAGEVPEGAAWCPHCGGDVRPPAAPASPSAAPPPARAATCPHQSGRGADPPPPVHLEIDRATDFAQNKKCLLRFRVTNSAATACRVTLRAEVRDAKQDEEEKEAVHELAPGRAGRFDISFKPVEYGSLTVRRVSVCVEDPEAGRPARRYTVPPETVLEIPVARDPAAAAGAGSVIHISHLQSQGNAPIAVNVAPVAFGDAAPGLAGIPVLRVENWETLRLVEERPRGPAVQIGSRTVRLPAEARPPRPMPPAFKLVGLAAPAAAAAAPAADAGAGAAGGAASAPGLKVFIFSQPVVRFGRAGESQGTRANEIVLRLLPYDPRRTDEPHQNISGFHGEFRLEADRVLVVDTSSKGTALNGERLRTGKPVGLPDDCRLDVAGALTFRVQVFRERGEVEAVRVQRETNAPGHAYVLVRRHATIGGSPGAAILVADARVNAVHAHLYAYEGSFVLADEAGDEAETRLDGRPLTGQQGAFVLPGSVLALGPVELRAEAISPEDFKTL